MIFSCAPLIISFAVDLWVIEPMDQAGETYITLTPYSTVKENPVYIKDSEHISAYRLCEQDSVAALKVISVNLITI